MEDTPILFSESDFTPTSFIGRASLWWRYNIKKLFYPSEIPFYGKAFQDSESMQVLPEETFDDVDDNENEEEITEEPEQEYNFYGAFKETLKTGYHFIRKHPLKTIVTIASTATLVYAGNRSDTSNFKSLTAPQFPQWITPSWQMTGVLVTAARASTTFGLSYKSLGPKFAAPAALTEFILSMPQIVSADLTTGLVAHYTFDGDANDVWGGSDAALFNGATFAPGKFNQAINFDGIDDYVKGAADNFPTAARTISFWLYTDFPLLHQGLFGYGGGDSCGKTLMIIMNNLDAPNALDVQSHCRANRLLYVYNATPPIGRWVHVAVRIRTDGTCWFVDGQNKICNSNYITNTNVTGKDFSFGCVVSVQGYAPYVDGYSGYFNGMLDEARIYSRGLTNTEIQELYDLGNNSSSTTIPTTQSQTAIQPTPSAYFETIGGGDLDSGRSMSLAANGDAISNGK